jgi:ribonuclease Z
MGQHTFKSRITAIGIVIVLLIAVAMGLFYIFEDNIIIYGIRDQVKRRMVQPVSRLDEKGLRVILLGTGSPIVDKARTMPCSAVIAGGHILIFDAGLSASRQFGIKNLSWDDLDAVFLTHIHDDHFSGLGELIMSRWMLCGMSKKSNPLTVFGPYGTSGVVNGFNAVYEYQNRIRSNAVYGYPLSGSRGEAHEISIPGMEKRLVYDKDGIRVYAFHVDHTNPYAVKKVPFDAFAYRVEYRGRSVVFSGDCRGDSRITRENLERYSKDADILIMEMYPKFITDNALIAMKDFGLADYARQLQTASAHHTTDIEGAKIAQNANVKMLVFNHLIPTDFLIKRQTLRRIGEYFQGECAVSEDFMEIYLPPVD